MFTKTHTHTHAYAHKGGVLCNVRQTTESFFVKFFFLFIPLHSADDPAPFFCNKPTLIPSRLHYSFISCLWWVCQPWSLLICSVVIIWMILLFLQQCRCRSITSASLKDLPRFCLFIVILLCCFQVKKHKIFQIFPDNHIYLVDFSMSIMGRIFSAE